MVVHHNAAEEPLNTKERVQVARRKEALHREVDEEMAGQFLQQAARRKVFDEKANYLRWQNTQHQVLQKRLDAEMSSWILEAIESWDQGRTLGPAEPEKGGRRGGEKEVSDTDLIFEYLTKRAAHIDTGKLPSEIPLFKTMHASYSLPAMWRDKY